RATDCLLPVIGRNGFLPGRLDGEWRPRVKWSCLTGSCQLALVWFRLARRVGPPAYEEAARRTLSFVEKTQRSGPDHRPAGPADGTCGGIKGSHPIWGGYDPFRYPNWAAKFFVDALLASAE